MSTFFTHCLNGDQTEEVGAISQIPVNCKDPGAGSLVDRFPLPALGTEDSPSGQVDASDLNEALDGLLVNPSTNSVNVILAYSKITK